MRFKPTEMAMNPNKINILSIDGGGYRSIMSVIILMELELRTKRNITSLFNMVGGTSTGAILAAALNFPTWLNPKKPKYNSKDLLTLFNKNVVKMFTNDTTLNPQYKYDKLFSFIDMQLFGKPKYDGQNRERVLEKQFQLRQMDTSIRQLLIPTFDANQDSTVWFDSSWYGEDSQKNYITLSEAQIESNEEDFSDLQKIEIEDWKFTDVIQASMGAPNIWATM